MNSKKLKIIVLILLLSQLISAGVCYFLFGEFYIISTFLGSLIPIFMYLNQTKNSIDK